MWSAPITIELTQLPRQALDRHYSQFANEVPQDAAAPTGSGAADFTRHLEGLNGRSVSKVDAAGQTSPVARIQAVDGASVDPVGRVYGAESSVLAEASTGRVPAWTLPQASPAEAVAAKSLIAGRGIQEMLHTQVEVAEVRAKVGLAAAGVHKTTQGVDTLLKSQ